MMLWISCILSVPGRMFFICEEAMKKTILILVLMIAAISIAATVSGCGKSGAETNPSVPAAGADEGGGTDSGQTDEGADGDGTDRDDGKTGEGAGSAGQESPGKETPSDPNPGTTTEPARTVTIQINCKLLLGKDLTESGLAPLVPADGILLATTKVALNEGETVYSLSRRITRDKGIHLSAQGSPELGTLYVEAIGNIYEKAYNSKSGWIYLVNGKKPATSAGLYALKPGDVLVWAYSLDLGNDL